MRYYESLYIVNPNYEQGKLDEVMKAVTEAISDYGFNPINHFVWGKKRLAYNIQEHKYGSYILLHFETETSENLESFERFMVLQKSILRNQTVVLDEKPIEQLEKVSSNDNDKKDLTKDSVEKTTKSLSEDKSKDFETNDLIKNKEETPTTEDQTSTEEEQILAAEEKDEEDHSDEVGENEENK